VFLNTRRDVRLLGVDYSPAIASCNAVFKLIHAEGLGEGATEAVFPELTYDRISGVTGSNDRLDRQDRSLTAS